MKFNDQVAPIRRVPSTKVMLGDVNNWILTSWFSQSSEAVQLLLIDMSLYLQEQSKRDTAINQVHKDIEEATS